MCQDHYVFLSKVVRPTISSRHNERDPHQVLQIAAKVGGRPGGETFRYHNGYLYLAARTPTAESCLGKYCLGSRSIKPLLKWLQDGDYGLVLCADETIPPITFLNQSWKRNKTLGRTGSSEETRNEISRIPLKLTLLMRLNHPSELMFYEDGRCRLKAALNYCIK